MNSRIAVTTTLVLLLGSAMFAAASAPAKAPRRGTIALDGLSAPDVVRRLREAAESANPGDFDAIGLALAAEASRARPVLDLLEGDASVASATLRSELLVWMARGNDVRDGAKTGAMPTGELGDRARILLDHDDPFVRGLAEWALSIRFGMDYESAEDRVNGHRVPRAWPGKDGPDWFRRWEAFSADDLLEFDYVRQASAMGWHRSVDRLCSSGESAVRRAEELLAYARPRGSPVAVVGIESALAEARSRLAALLEIRGSASPSLTQARRQWLDLRRATRRAVLATPDINFDELLFGLRPAARTGGNITSGRWNVHPPGGDLVVKPLRDIAAPGRALLQGRLGPGHVRGLDLHWDADRLVFAYSRQPPADGAARLRSNHAIGGYFGQGIGATEVMSRLFEMRLDGSGLRELTRSARHADQEPAYLPNGDIVFVSDRSNFGSQCAGALDQDNMILNLYRCDPDGGNLRPLSNNKDFDRHPRVMDDGRILFLHWEYQERHLWNTHTLWTSRPDGRMTDALFKQHVESGPMSLRDARQIPGTDRLMAIACGHHNYEQGAIFLCDYGQGINERAAMRNLTPGVSGTEGGYGGVKPVPEGGVPDRGGHYMFPFPLSERSALAAFSYKRPENLAGQNFGLYYVDVWGNKELLHRDRRLSVAFIAPVRRSTVPPVVRDLPRDDTAEVRQAIAIVGDVAAGWPAEKRGVVKYLRISQKVPWPCVPDDTKACGFNDLHWMPAAWEHVLGTWDWGHARVIGTVPVEADGSAHFRVPADQPVYFHALDENFVEVRRMRSNVTFPAGETRSCIGCHESQAVAPPAGREVTLRALRRAPSTPEPPPWGDRVVPDYERDIQPIFNRHCLDCHGEGEPKGGLEFTSRRIDGYFQSYRTLFGLKPSDTTPMTRGYWTTWHPAEPARSEADYATAKTVLRGMMQAPAPAQLVSIADFFGGAEVTRLEQFGSSRSRLIQTLLHDDEHRREVAMSRDEWVALVTWVDLNAQYWGTFVEKDAHYAARESGAKGAALPPPRRVRAEFPDPWRHPPTGEWRWIDAHTVAIRP